MVRAKTFLVRLYMIPETLIALRICYKVEQKLQLGLLLAISFRNKRP